MTHGQGMKSVDEGAMTPVKLALMKEPVNGTFWRDEEQRSLVNDSAWVKAMLNRRRK